MRRCAGRFRRPNSVLGNQSLEAELLRDPEQFFLGTAELVREPDVIRRFLEELRQQFAPSAQWFIAQIFAFQEEQIEDVIDQRDVSRHFE
jgi:hypothetical protein